MFMCSNPQVNMLALFYMVMKHANHYFSAIFAIAIGIAERSYFS